MTGRTAWALAALGCLVAGLMLGRLTAASPTRVEYLTVERVRVLQGEARVETRLVEVAGRTREVTRWLPGQVVERVVEREVAAKEREARVETRTVEVESKVEVERRAVVELRPRWGVGATVGLLGGRNYGGSAEVRVAGPVWVGAWANTQRQAGLGLAVRW